MMMLRTPPGGHIQSGRADQLMAALPGNGCQSRVAGLAGSPRARFNASANNRQKNFPPMKRTTFHLALVSCTVALMTPSFARADSCDDLAAQLASQIGGLTVGKTAAGVIYLSHPSVKRASLGCSSRNRENDIYALTDKKKPTPEFFDFVASATALVFSIPKQDALRGAQRCTSRIGIIRGYNIETRYRKLDIVCDRADTGTSVTISRAKDE